MLSRAVSIVARRTLVAPWAHAHRQLATVTLFANTNQALGIAQYAKDMVDGKYAPTIDEFGDSSGEIDDAVWERVEMFHTDSVMCGLSALALKTNAPTILREEALEYADAKGATVFGSSVKCAPEKVIAANSSAVREWDSNGTVFGYNPFVPGHEAGEFGHNDFYPVVLAAAQVTGNVDGRKALLAMIALDEIRGRLAEVFSLKSYKIDHVVHGAIASAAVYGALHGATAEQIESAIGMSVAHYTPMRAIRAGKQLSDSKGASAALSTEAAVLSMRRAMRGFVGPKDIFRNPEAIFRFFEPTTGVENIKEAGTSVTNDNIDITLGNKVRWGPGPSPFNLVLSHGGTDFAVMGMHFKLGLYEHQSAGALEGLIQALVNNPELLSGGADGIENINIVAYEPAYGIIGDPAKMDPKTRQSADHSMAFIVSRILVKAQKAGKVPAAMDDAWMELMLSPYDYGIDALYDPDTRAMMAKITFSHGGKDYDRDYPAGIPTSMDITLKGGKLINSGYIMYPSGHARNRTANLKTILAHKNRMLGDIVFAERSKVDGFVSNLANMINLSADEVKEATNFDYSSMRSHKCIDGE